MQYTFLTDPGHGWMCVTRSEIIRLGLSEKISRFSYQKGELVYLEEDCDASRFLAEKRDRNEPFTIKETHTDRDHWIRHLQPFSAETASVGWTSVTA